MPEEGPEVDFESFWGRIRPPSKECTKCRIETNPADGSQVLWRCHVCNRLVCRECTLTVPESVSFRGLETARANLRRRRTSPVLPLDLLDEDEPPVFVELPELEPELNEAGTLVLSGGREYLTMTLCSRDCWEAAGRPDE